MKIQIFGSLVLCFLVACSPKTPENTSPKEVSPTFLKDLTANPENDLSNIIPTEDGLIDLHKKTKIQYLGEFKTERPLDTKLVLSHEVVAFGTLKNKQIAGYRISVKNIGVDPASNIKLSSHNDFAIGSDRCSGLSLATDEVCTFRALFSAENKEIGEYQGQIKVFADIDAEAELKLQAEVKNTTTINLESMQGNVIEFNAQSNKKVVRNVRIVNRGPGIADNMATKVWSGDFQIIENGCNGASLGKDQYCTISLSFDPLKNPLHQVYRTSLTLEATDYPDKKVKITLQTGNNQVIAVNEPMPKEQEKSKIKIEEPKELTQIQEKPELKAPILDYNLKKLNKLDQLSSQKQNNIKNLEEKIKQEQEAKEAEANRLSELKKKQEENRLKLQASEAEKQRLAEIEEEKNRAKLQEQQLALKKQQEALALKKKQEQEANLKAQKEQQEKDAQLAQEKLKKEAEALAKKEQERLAKLELEKIKAEALKKQKEEELAKKEQERLQALQRQQEKLAKLEADRIKKEELRKQEEDKIAQANALKKQQELALAEKKRLDEQRHQEQTRLAQEAEIKKMQDLAIKQEQELLAQQKQMQLDKEKKEQELNQKLEVEAKRKKTLEEERQRQLIVESENKKKEQDLQAQQQLLAQQEQKKKQEELVAQKNKEEQLKLEEELRLKKDAELLAQEQAESKRLAQVQAQEREAWLALEQQSSEKNNITLPTKKVANVDSYIKDMEPTQTSEESEPATVLVPDPEGSYVGVGMGEIGIKTPEPLEISWFKGLIPYNIYQRLAPTQSQLLPIEVDPAQLSEGKIINQKELLSIVQSPMMNFNATNLEREIKLEIQASQQGCKFEGVFSFMKCLAGNVSLYVKDIINLQGPLKITSGDQESNELGVKKYSISQVSQYMIPTNSTLPSQAVYKGEFYFQAKLLENQHKLFKISGFNIFQVSNINEGKDDAPWKMVVHKGELYFAALDKNGNSKLFKTNGNKVVQLSNIFPQGNDYLTPAIVYNNELYLEGMNNDGYLKLFKTDGNKIIQISDTNPSGSDSPSDFAVYQNELYFRSENMAGHSKLFKLNEKGIAQVSDINPKQHDAPEFLKVFNGQLYFSAYIDKVGSKLFKTDGKKISQVLNINAGNDEPSDLTVFKDSLYFVAINPQGYRKLFKTNGQEEAVQVSNIRSGSDFALDYRNKKSYLTEYNEELFFVAKNEKNGFKIFKTEGQTISQVSDVNQPHEEYNPTGSDFPFNLMVYNDELFFSAYSNQTGLKMFKLKSEHYLPKPKMDKL